MSTSPFRRQSVLWPIACGRMLMGLLWLFSLRWKMPPDFQSGTERGLRFWLEQEVEHAAFGFYGGFIADTVLPNFTLFAWLVFVAELVVGLGLLTGTLTRLMAGIGLLMSINLGIGLLDVPSEWPWSYVMMAMWHGTIAITAAGRLWGVDSRLRRRTRSGFIRLVS